MEEVQQKEYKAKKKKIPIGVIIVGVCLFIFLLIGLSSDGNLPQIGDEFLLNYNKSSFDCSGKVVVPINEESRDAYGKAAVAGDNEEIAMLVVSGQAFFVPNCTQVKVIDRSTFMRKIRIMDGEQAMRSGWVPNEYLK